MRRIALDIEADGMRPNNVCQLAYLIINGPFVRGKNMFFAVRAVNRYAQRVHGFSAAQLRKLSGGEKFPERADEIFRDFASCKQIIGHDVTNDIRFISTEFRRIGVTFPKLEPFCTMKRYTELLGIPQKQNPNQLKPPRLEELIHFFGITEEEIVKKCKKWFGGGERAHDARYDVTATYLCMLAGEKMLKKRAREERRRMMKGMVLKVEE